MALDGLKVLLVEDDIFIQMDLQMLLEEEGMRVVTASNVAEGLANADGPFNAAVLDIVLPDGDVFPVAEALVEKETPIIFHSGNTETSHVRELYPDAIALSKPTSRGVLLDALRQVLPKPPRTH